jgi:hypothetical protein
MAWQHGTCHGTVVVSVFRVQWQQLRQVFRVAALAAQFLEPAKAQQIFALEASRIQPTTIVDICGKIW